MNLAEKSCVLFDFDGTLADTLRGIVSTAEVVLSDMGISEERLKDCPKLVGPPFPAAFTLVFGLSEKDARLATERYRAIYEKLGKSAWPAFAGIDELLRDLQAAGKTLAVVSSKRDPLVRRAVADNGLDGYFDLVLGKTKSEEQEKAESLAEAIASLGKELDDCIMVGDRCYDIIAAKKVGCASIGVLWGKTAEPGELEEAGADVVCQTIDDMRRLLLPS